MAIDREFRLGKEPIMNDKEEGKSKPNITSYPDKIAKRGKGSRFELFFLSLAAAVIPAVAQAGNNAVVPKVAIPRVNVPHCNAPQGALTGSQLKSISGAGGAQRGTQKGWIESSGGYVEHSTPK